MQIHLGTISIGMGRSSLQERYGVSFLREMSALNFRRGFSLQAHVACLVVTSSDLFSLRVEAVSE